MKRLTAALAIALLAPALNAGTRPAAPATVTIPTLQLAISEAGGGFRAGNITGGAETVAQVIARVSGLAGATSTPGGGVTVPVILSIDTEGASYIADITIGPDGSVTVSNTRVRRR